MTSHTRQQIIAAAREIDVSVAEMPLGRAVSQARRHYNQRNPDKPPAELNSSDEFLARITVNFLRHVCSHYDSVRSFLRGITDDETRRQAGAIIKGRQLADVARKYPELEEAARAQSVREDRKP